MLPKLDMPETSVIDQFIMFFTDLFTYFFG